jgi:hypothetical protein
MPNIPKRWTRSRSLTQQLANKPRAWKETRDYMTASLRAGEEPFLFRRELKIARLMRVWQQITRLKRMWERNFSRAEIGKNTLLCWRQPKVLLTLRFKSDVFLHWLLVSSFKDDIPTGEAIQCSSHKSAICSCKCSEAGSAMMAYLERRVLSLTAEDGLLCGDRRFTGVGWGRNVV